MNITVVVEPAFEPVTLAQVYAHLRLDPSGSPLAHPDDDMLLRHIKTARAAVEHEARRSLVQQTLRLAVAGFPARCDSRLLSRWATTPVREIRLYRPPVIRVEAVRYFDADNVLQTVDRASYYVTDEQVPELRFVSGFVTPTVYDRPDAVRVEYVAGYAPSGSPSEVAADYIGNVPSELKDAILLGVQLLYDDLAPADRDDLVRARAALVGAKQIPLAL